MVATLLAKGANTSITNGDSTSPDLIRISVTVESDDQIVTDTSALLLGEDGKVRSNEDLVFYNQPTSTDGSVQLLPGSDGDATATSDAIVIDLGKVPADVARIVMCTSIDPDTDATFGDLTSATLIAGTDDADIAVFPIDGLTTERALILGEVYRRDPGWKIRAVGQGYADGLGPLAGDFGIEVDNAAEPAPGEEPPAGTNPGESVPTDTNVKIRRRRRAPKLPEDWQERTTPYLPVAPATQFHPARLFPATGSKSSTDLEIRATSILLATMELVRDFGRALTQAVGAPGGRIETFVEPAFTFNGAEARPDGLIRVTRGTTAWTALVEIKIGKRPLEVDQINTYLALAKDRKFDAVITISSDLRPIAGTWSVEPDEKLTKSVALHHLGWEEVIATASSVLCHSGVADRDRSRVLDEYLIYATHPSSGLGVFDDMGKHWVHVRDAVKTRTVSPRDSAPADVCAHFDRLIRHISLQLTAMLGQRVQAVPPTEQKDAVSRARQLADSGKLFGTLRTAGAVGPIIVEADLARDKASCSITVGAPRTGRPLTHVNSLLKDLSDVGAMARVTAHHSGTREVTAVLLRDVREEPASLVPGDGRSIREFTVTVERSIGTKRGGSATGFPSTITELVNDFYASVVSALTPPTRKT